jgi:multidrug efflux pump subunit AcrB
MTLGGLALAVGTVVDAGIVVVENIIRHLDRGESAYEAAQKGAEEVAAPVLAGTITTLAIFLPALFLSGMVRYLFEPLALTAAVSIAASYVFAMTLLPAFCARFFKARHQDKSEYRTSETTASRSRYTMVFHRSVQRPWATSFCVFAVAFGCCLLLPRVGTELFPSVDDGVLKLGCEHCRALVLKKQRFSLSKSRPLLNRSFLLIN